MKNNANLQEVLDKGTEEVITVLMKDNHFGVFFHEVCDEIKLDPYIIGVVCNMIIKNYVDALPDSIQLQAMDLCYKAIDAGKSFIEENERTTEEVFGEE